MTEQISNEVTSENVLIAGISRQQPDFDYTMTELGELAKADNYTVVGEVRQNLDLAVAFAHAALEAGVRVVAGYPGTPSSELIETVAKLHGDRKSVV